MKSTYAKITLVGLIVGLLAACSSQATGTPVSRPAETAVSLTQAPTDPPAAAQGATVSFAKDVLPIIQSRCVNCHGENRTEKNLNLKTYDQIMSGSENGPVIAPGNAADSKLVELITNQKMPKRGPKLTPPQVQLIADWVNQGALNN